MELTQAQIKNRDYNLSQTATGHPLRTLKGSAVKRSKYGVGKLIGGQIYFQSSYKHDILDDELLACIYEMEDMIPFDYNCIRYDIKKDVLTLVESPNFDTAREPVVGRMATLDVYGNLKVTRFYNQIYHHKWAWTRDDYLGFDVRESWEWSKEWLSVLTEPADGSNLQNWLNQLHRFGLE